MVWPESQDTLTSIRAVFCENTATLTLSDFIVRYNFELVFLKILKKWPKFDEKIDKFYFSRNRAVGCIFLYPASEAKSKIEKNFFFEKFQKMARI